MLSAEEYIEQAFFFENFQRRIEDGYSAQECLSSLQGELLATAHLPKAVSFLLTEIKHSGLLSAAMRMLPHYFTPFQTFVISESEKEGGRFDFRIALQILEREAKYRGSFPPVQGLFFYQFETLCRNRLGYIQGIDLLRQDDTYNSDWKGWLNILSHQIGLVDLAEMIYYRSEYYAKTNKERNPLNNGVKRPVVLFGEREGHIAYAARRKEPAFLFSALSRHLGYPSVPRQKRATEEENIVPQLKRRIETLESRLQILEEERHGGIQLEKFYAK